MMKRKEFKIMRTGLCIVALSLVLLCGCHRSKVQLTITYDRFPQTVYPYASYGDVAKIYWTEGVTNYEKEVRNHQSIKVTVPPRTAMRASMQKYVTDLNGFHVATEDVFYTADHKNPVWKF